ncbi:hypothetical protein LRP88_12955 [Fusarium phalaenopsidis]
MHNVIHVASFAEECNSLRWEQATPSMAWQSLYWSMMSTGLFYMKHQSCVELGVQDKTTLTETCYRRALDALASSDFMAVHSVHALQAICLIVPCAYALGDSKRIIVLLSSATCIAQLMRIHVLGPTPSEPASANSLMEHEIKKRIWYFLVIQDSYLTTFKGTYNIVPAHAKTPLPVNCSEVMEEFQEAGKACLDAARMLLLTYRDTAQASEFDSWTVPAHVISASLIIALDIVLGDSGDDFDPNVARSFADDKGLMLECLELVAATQSSLLVKRGLTLVSKLLADRERRSPAYSRFDGPEISKLVQEVEDALATEEAPPTAYNVTFEEYLDMMGNDPFAFMDDESRLLD